MNKKKQNLKKNLKETFFLRLSSKPSRPLWKGPTQYVQHELASLLITRSIQTHVEKSLSARGSNFPSTLHEVLCMYLLFFFFFLKSLSLFTSRTSRSVRLSVHPRVCFLGGDLQQMLGLARKIWLISIEYISYSTQIHTHTHKSSFTYFISHGTCIKYTRSRTHGIILDYTVIIKHSWMSWLFHEMQGKMPVFY